MMGDVEWPRRRDGLDLPAGAAALHDGARRLATADDRRTTRWGTAAAVAAVAWAIVGFVAEDARLVTLAPRAQSVVETAAAVSRLFGALILFLVPVADDANRRRMRWVAAGLLVTGLGALTFGTLPSLLPEPLDLNTSMYAANAVWVIAGGLCAVGLVPAEPPPFRVRPVPVALALGAVAGVVVLAALDALPSLVGRHDLASALVQHRPPLPGLTGWHWLVGAVPLVLTGAAAVGADRWCRRDALGGWLAVAMALAAGSLLHNLLWPSTYTPILASASLLRFAFAAVVSVGGVVALRQIAVERAELLAAEREAAQRGEELAALRADFGRMVAHELGSPIAAIGGQVEMLATGELDPTETADVIATIRAETGVLHGLVADVRAMSTVERDGFAVRPRPVPIEELVLNAAAINRTLPGEHPLLTTIAASGAVRADPDRVDQVLRNLLGNAAKYTPPGTPIELRATEHDGRVRIEVADRGPGVHPDDADRIFEKFGRARERHGGDIPGVGLGLYISQRIVEAHGGRLAVRPTPGGGATFGFELEVVR